MQNLRSKNITEPLKDKKILISAGPVWVPIDKVRAITNIFGGALGLTIALEAQKQGAKITLLLGPGRVQLPVPFPENIRLIRFKFFDEFFDLIKKELVSKSYNAVIHSAAVSDYKPVSNYKGKIKSGKKFLTIDLEPTIKIVDKIKSWDPDIFLVKFKLEVGKQKTGLINRAYQSMLDSKADLIVANDLYDMKPRHRAYIIGPDKQIKRCITKNQIAKNLLQIIGAH